MFSLPNHLLETAIIALQSDNGFIPTQTRDTGMLYHTIESSHKLVLLLAITFPPVPQVYITTLQIFSSCDNNKCAFMTFPIVTIILTSRLTLLNIEPSDFQRISNEIVSCPFILQIWQINANLISAEWCQGDL